MELRASWVVATVTALGAVGCGSRAPGPTEGRVPGPAQTPAPPASPAPAVFDVHEWGVLDVDAQGTALRAAPSASSDVASLLGGIGLAGSGSIIGGGGGGGSGLGKPVLYVHLAPGTDEASIDVGVTLGGDGARIVERWPGPPEPPAGGGASVRWEGVRVRRGACPEGSVVLPPRAESACVGVDDGVCERAALGDFVTRDADCLEVPGDGGPVRAPLLFYRGASLGGAPLPLAVTLGAGGVVTVTHTGGGAPLGRLVHVRLDPTGVRARTVARVVDAPPPGGTLTLPALPDRPGGGAGSTDADGVLAALDEGLRGAGLTASEVATFREVWDAELVGPPGAGDSRGEDGATGDPAASGAAGSEPTRGGGRADRPRRGPGGGASAGTGRLVLPREELWYFLPPDAAAAVARLDVAPPPRALRRALLVRVRLASAPSPRERRRGGP